MNNQFIRAIFRSDELEGQFYASIKRCRSIKKPVKNILQCCSRLKKRRAVSFWTSWRIVLLHIGPCSPTPIISLAWACVKKFWTLLWNFNLPRGRRRRPYLLKFKIQAAPKRRLPQSAQQTQSKPRSPPPGTSAAAGGCGPARRGSSGTPWQSPARPPAGTPR